MTSRILAGLVVVLLVVAGVGVWQRDRLFGGDSPATQAAQELARAWLGDRLDEVEWAGADQEQAGRVFTDSGDGMSSTGTDHPVAVTAGEAVVDGAQATAPLTVSWQVAPSSLWTYTSSLTLRRTGDVWRPVADIAAVAPGLADGQALEATVQRPDRADVLGAGGQQLVTARPVVEVGIEPQRSTDLPASVATTVGVLATFDVTLDAEALLARARAAKDDAFVSIVTLRQEVYDRAKPALQPIPGTVFRTGARQLAPSAEFARALLGTVGPATAEIISKSGGAVKAGDEVGRSGLQQQFDDQLSGEDGVVVTAADPTAPADAAPQVLFEVEKKPGTPLRLTLDLATQQAADAALAAAATPASLVALRVSTGEVLAVANSAPDGDPGFDRALLGRYPPGSTFKTVSGLALLQQGLAPTEKVDCPATLTVNGKVFRNAEQEVLGRVPFATDFADSCNTAFVGSADRVTPEQLTATATALGYRPYDLGTPTADSQAPAAADPVGHAASMIGQASILATPLTVAITSASVAAGRSVTPRLFEGEAARPGEALDPALVATLQGLMRGVVTEGTGTALAPVPGGPVAGKTGTAEYGTDDPPRTHAWFTGYQGDLAFAVLVEDGGFGAVTAAPLAASFLTSLAG